ncbi:hypothetical protein PCA10_41200 [Metapseudomonas resinovorans NBRC 106553]|uniref:Uncharacterized protein n=1 Tax=Metapseudomonas resinovorans NBRC 106553 TaxID=1245471 RepID=S6AH77_METRE|nr:hypothetical protein PCA10_41200 [Pseudomonas resinovorans NBRC 106553]
MNREDFSTSVHQGSARWNDAATANDQPDVPCQGAEWEAGYLLPQWLSAPDCRIATARPSAPGWLRRLLRKAPAPAPWPSR